MSWNLPYIVGTTLGRDHQQWPTVTPAEFATFATPNPRLQLVELDTIMLWAWRVKKWQVSGTYELTLPYTSISPPYSGFATYSFTFPDAASSPAAPIYVPVRTKKPGFPASDLIATKEIDLIAVQEAADPTLSREFKFHGLMNEGTTEFNLSAIVSMGFTADPNFFDPPSDPFNAVMSVYFNDLLFAYAYGGIPGEGALQRSQFIPFDSTATPPTFYPFVEHAGRFDSLRAGVAGKIGKIQFLVSAVNPNGTLTIDPLLADPIEWPMRIDGSLDANVINPDPAGVGMCEVTLTAKEFWAYQNSLGQPVYDTVTGAQINDPFA